MIHAALGGRCLVAGVLFSPPSAEEGMQIQCKSPFFRYCRSIRFSISAACSLPDGDQIGDIDEKEAAS